MSRRSQLQAKHVSPPLPSFTPSPSVLLQRKCACGGTPGPGGECAECRKKRLGLQRRATGHHAPATVPPVVREVLGSPGRPLDAQTRAFMEPRFGHDFGQVRVHTDERAAESARAVGALAYTLGRDVVFGAGRYSPGSEEGRRLVAHELAHVVQQGSQGWAQGELEVGGVDDPLEREADAAASHALAERRSAPIPPLGRSTRRPPAIQRAAIHSGNILDEGTCEHLACNSKYACEDNENGIACPKGTRNASETKKYRPLFTCDTKCENNKTCSDSDNWMALPGERWARSKCNQDLVICANGKFTHGYVRDKSETEKAWEVSHGIQDSLGVSPYATFSGAIYPNESDAQFKKDVRCHGKIEPPPGEKSPQSETSPPGEPSPTPPVSRDNPSDVIDE
jgi:Domain of unknown function (DUF4157)